MNQFVTVKQEGNKIMITINIKQHLYQMVSVPLNDVKYRIEGDYIVVEAEIDIEKLLSNLG